MKTWEEYLRLSNHLIQQWEEHHELREVVANLLCDNDRLNNIINELEKWLKEDKEYAMNNFECGRCFNMFDILNKLQELKEGK